MVDTSTLDTMLGQTDRRLDHWRMQASQLRSLVEAARIAQMVNDDLLASVEETSEAIYAEIASLVKVINEKSAGSAETAARLQKANDDLHLVLMEITELGTAMYAVRSNLGHVEEQLLAPPQH
jgi:septal ring factor EnvC (AmiA/AmiB activator)